MTRSRRPYFELSVTFLNAVFVLWPLHVSSHFTMDDNRGFQTLHLIEHSIPQIVSSCRSSDGNANGKNHMSNRIRSIAGIRPKGLARYSGTVPCELSCFCLVLHNYMIISIHCNHVAVFQ